MRYEMSYKIIMARNKLSRALAQRTTSQLNLVVKNKIKQYWTGTFQWPGRPLSAIQCSE